MVGMAETGQVAPDVAHGTDARKVGFREKQHSVLEGISGKILGDDDPTKIRSKMSMERPQTHRLPWFVIWSITLSVPVLVAFANYLIVILEHGLQDNKFKVMQEAFDKGGAWMGTVVLAAFSGTFAGVATYLVSWVGPMCAGSGLPEAKGYLNGNSIPGMFTKRNLVVRILGITFACAAGYPIGREGPMVCIGGSIGFQVVDKLARRWVRRWVNVHTQGEGAEMTPALIIDEERFAHARRIGCALGGAAGIAAAFNAPIGGILYMFEEVTVTSWPPELTFRAFVVTVLAALISRGCLNLTHDDVHHLVIFDDKKAMEDTSWDWADVPFFFVLAIAIGFLSAGFTRCALWVWTKRKEFQQAPTLRRWKKVIKASEAVIFAVVCATCVALLPLLLQCVAEPGKQVGGAVGVAQEGVRFVRHDCEAGEHREVATLLLTGAQESVKHLFSRHHNSDLSLGALAIVGFFYTVLAMGMPGLPVPMGLFVPCLLIGAVVGRFVGEAVQEVDFQFAHPGVYALVGSAAMLSGFTHMTIAIVVLLVEAAADLSLVCPVMVGIFVASIVSKLVNHHAFDEVLILKKGVPFLDAEVPHEMDNDGSTAGDLCDIYPDEVLLEWQADAGVVIKALDYGNRMYMDFPVVDGSRCIGMTTRSRLEATVQALRTGPRLGRSGSAGSSMSDLQFGGSSSSRHLHEEEKTLGITRFVSGLAGPMRCGNEQLAEERIVVPIHRVMDRCPYTILEDMPAPRFYPLFIKAGVHAAAVVSNDGDFIGVLRRVNLISQSRDIHLPEMHRKKSGNALQAEPSTSTLGTSHSGSTTSSRAYWPSKVAEKDRVISQLKAEIEALRAEAGNDADNQVRSNTVEAI